LPVAAPTKAAARTKWANEDVDEEAAVSGPLCTVAHSCSFDHPCCPSPLTTPKDDWDASEDEKPKAAPATNTAAIKKKSTLKQKLAEKEKLAAEAVSLADS